jgi:adenylate kinase family enzyme
VEVGVAAFLITGNPGSGKTTVALELTRRGFTALDTDAIAGWETATGVSVSQPEHATDEWLLEHRWVWSSGRAASDRILRHCPKIAARWVGEFG